MKKLAIVFLSINLISFTVFSSEAHNKMALSGHLHGINEASTPTVLPPYPMPIIQKQSSQDLLLSLRVEKELVNQIENFNVNQNMIMSRNGVITLQGKANSLDDVKRMLAVISKVQGVERIKNKMIVLGSGFDLIE
jgi:hypothetical protein